MANGTTPEGVTDPAKRQTLKTLGKLFVAGGLAYVGHKLGLDKAETVNAQPGMWTFTDETGTPVEVPQVEGITLDPEILNSPYPNISDIEMRDINPNNIVNLGGAITESDPFNSFLNDPSSNPTGKALAGYKYGFNDTNRFGEDDTPRDPEWTGGHSSPQIDMYSWKVFTGEKIEIEGIGDIETQPGEAAMVLILNRAPDVDQFDDREVVIDAGYEGTGQLWDASDPDVLTEASSRLVEYHAHKLSPNSDFIGQCSSETNCDVAKVLVVDRVQWGNYDGGDPRYTYRFVAAGDVNLH